MVNGAGPAHGKEASEGGRVSGGEGSLCGWGVGSMAVAQGERPCAA